MLFCLQNSFLLKHSDVKREDVLCSYPSSNNIIPRSAVAATASLCVLSCDPQRKCLLMPAYHSPSLPSGSEQWHRSSQHSVLASQACVVVRVLGVPSVMLVLSDCTASRHHLPLHSLLCPVRVHPLFFSCSITLPPRHPQCVLFS